MPQKAPALLNDDGSASIGTTLMMSHHGFRRDLALFAMALRRVAEGDHAKVAALQEEWKSYHATLHGHHTAEDTGLFPNVAGREPALVPVIEGLTADHHRIAPLLEEGDRAFAALPATERALAVVGELSALLDAHLATEEAKVVPFLRAAKAFPPPANDAEEQMYAQGFAWACHGVAAEVLERVFVMLPGSLNARIPAARAAYEKRCERVWGTAKTGASRTPIPDWLSG
jgi:hypothetical protein